MIGRVVWVDYKDSTQYGPVARVGIRMKDGSKKNCYITDVEPWGFVHEDADIPERNWIKRIEHGYESLFDEPLKKIVTTKPSKVNSSNDNDTMADYVDEHYESDIPMYRKLSIIDGISGYVRLPDEPQDTNNGIEIYGYESIDLDPDFDEAIEPRVMLADIEVRIGDESFDRTRELASQPINVICSYDNYDDEYSVFYYDKYDSLSNPAEVREIVESQIETEDGYENTSINLSVSPTEASMANSFINYVREKDFDLTSGWNWTDFDYEYIINRFSDLDGVSKSRLSPFGDVGWTNNKRMRIKGLPSFDMMRGFCDKMTFSNWRSKSLDYVSNEELGVGKVDDVEINEDWQNYPERLIGYNIVDVILTVMLDDVNDIHNFFFEMGDVCSIPVYDTFFEKRLVDGYIMSRRKHDEILPSADESELVENAGGYVADAIDGTKDNLGVSDLKSLYPSAIITWNISTETVAETPEDFDEYVKIPKVPEPKDVDGDILQKSIDYDWLYASLDEEGLIPRTTKKLFKKRNREKGKMYAADDPQEERKWDRKQGATKVVMNSIYGNVSSKYYRLSNEYLGDAVTSTARYTLWKGEQTIDRLGYGHIYSDSIVGERNVVVRNPEGIIKCMPIEDLWDKATFIKKNGKEYATLDGWEALSYSDELESEWKSINSVIRHETNKNVVELQHSKGSSITTEDHSYVLEEENGLVETKPNQVDAPLRIDVPNINKKNSVNLEKYVDEFSRQENSIGRGTNIVEKRIRRNKNQLYYGEEGSSDWKRTKFVESLVEDEQLESLMRLCGAYISDGSASTDKTSDCGKWGLSFANGDKEWLEQLESDYQSLFDGVSTCIVESDIRETRNVDGYEYSDDTLKLQCMNRLSAVVFDNLCGSTSSGKRLPEFTYNLEDKYKKILINALVKGDGSRKFDRYSEEYCKDNFTYTTKSSGLCSDLSTLLNQLDEKHFINYREQKETYTIRTADRYDGRAKKARLIKREGYDYVYDLSVEDNQNFVDGMGQVLLHNTDSHFIQLTEDTVEDRVNELKAVSEEMDSDASEILSDCGYDKKHPFLVNSDLHGDEYTCMMWEAEKVYDTFIQLGKKKRYAGNIAWKEGTYYSNPNVSISGFEFRRSDSPEVTADLQKKVIEMILLSANFKDVSAYVQSVIEDIDEDHPDVKKFALPGSINKDLEDYRNRQVPRASMYSNEHLGYEFGEGDSPFVYMDKDTPPGLPQTDVVAFEWNEDIPEGFKFDKEAIIERAIRKPIAPIINEVDWKFSEIREGEKAQELDIDNDTSNPFQ